MISYTHLRFWPSTGIMGMGEVVDSQYERLFLSEKWQTELKSQNINGIIWNWDKQDPAEPVNEKRIG